jgi:hypothetical protein
VASFVADDHERGLAYLERVYAARLIPVDGLIGEHAARMA